MPGPVPGAAHPQRLELGEPHRHRREVAAVLAAGPYDRVLGSVHSLRTGDGFAEPDVLYAHRDPAEVVRAYLLEVAELAGLSDTFAVLAHVDYPVRRWPAGRFDPTRFEAEFRHALGALARSGRALEINTVLPLQARIVRWWHEAGGDAVAFGSDAHEPAELARGFAAAAAMAEANGFRPAADPLALWGRG